MVSAALVFLMQCGFLFIEAGMVRSKNAINVAQKNIADMLLSVVMFCLVGFMFMFGSSAGGILGIEGKFFALDGMDEWGFTFFMFQAVFCGTAATIVSGAVAERMKFGGYLVVSVVVSVLIYPLFGHWAWGNLLDSNNTAWLADIGFLDFAGSTVVHSVGGWVALAMVVILGPRVGRFDEEGNPVRIHGHSSVLATMGALILWIGWIGFNGGSTTVGDGSFSPIVANTLIAGAFGGSVCMILGRFEDGHYRPDRSINGLLGGLVGITAGCNVVSIPSAMVIGTVGGLVAYYGAELLERKFKLDDAVGAVPVHGMGGLWGTIAVGIFAPADQLAAGGRFEQIAVQAGGALLAFVWAFGLGYVVFKAFDVFVERMRVSTEDELAGLNQVEHGATLGTGHLLKRMTELSYGQGDISTRLSEDSNDEAGELGFVFNRVMDNIEHLVRTVAREGQLLSASAEKMSRVSQSLSEQSEAAVNEASRAKGRASSANEASGQAAGSLDSAKHSATLIAERSGSLAGAVHQATSGVQTIEHEIHSIQDTTAQVRSVIEEALDQSTAAKTNVSQLSSAIDSISGILTMIEQVSNKTRMLALNATIEAARAGDAGKGFAVVAEEVKELADQTANAVEDIRDKVSGVVDEANHTVTIIEAITHTTEQMGSAVAQIADSVEAQSQSASTVVSQINQANDETNAVANQIRTVSTDVAQSSEQALSAAHDALGVMNDIEHVESVARQNLEQAQEVMMTSQEVAEVANRLTQLITRLTDTQTVYREAHHVMRSQPASAEHL
ncbi:MAG: ammonium transporter [Bradymonadia bacterium]